MVETRRIMGLGAPATSESGPIPQCLGVFQIVREMPHVGMGRIYEAVQEPLGRRVAVKTIRGEPDRDSPEAKAKFRTSRMPWRGCTTRTSCRSSRPARRETCSYFAMPYIHGASLSRLVRTASSPGLFRVVGLDALAGRARRRINMNGTDLPRESSDATPGDAGRLGPDPDPWRRTARGDT